MLFESFNFSDTLIKFDVCIIGGGPAGIATALEFEGSGYKVALIESGASKLNRKNQKLNNVNNIGIDYENLGVQRGRYLGGSSNMWGGNCIPLDPIDFRECNGRKNFSWPFDHLTISPYIKRAQKILGIDKVNFGNDLISKLALSNKNDEFDWKAWQFCDFPFRFGEKFRQQLEESQEIHCYLNSNLIGFNAINETNIAEEAIIKSLNGKEGKIKASQFVLACGGIENARLLLNIEDSGTFKSFNKNKKIGRYFAEHPNATIGYIKGKDADLIYKDHSIKYIGDGKEIKPGLGVNELVQEKDNLLNGIVSIWPVPAENSIITKVKLLLQLFRKREFGIKFLVTTFLILPKISQLLPHVRHRLKGGVISTPYRENYYEVRLMSETVPNIDSRVFLSKDTDSLGLKRASLDWKLLDQDKENFKNITKKTKKYFESKGDVNFIISPWLEDSSQDWTNFINKDGHYGHHMGTTIMSDSSADGVVDKDCKLYGIKNIFIAGSSVFPTYGFANPTLTIIALGMRLADHIKTLKK